MVPLCAVFLVKTLNMWDIIFPLDDIKYIIIQYPLNIKCIILTHRPPLIYIHACICLYMRSFLGIVTALGCCVAFALLFV